MVMPFGGGGNKIFGILWISEELKELIKNEKLGWKKHIIKKRMVKSRIHSCYNLLVHVLCKYAALWLCSIFLHHLEKKNFKMGFFPYFRQCDRSFALDAS